MNEKNFRVVVAILLVLNMMVTLALIGVSTVNNNEIKNINTDKIISKLESLEMKSVAVMNENTRLASCLWPRLNCDQAPPLFEFNNNNSYSYNNNNTSFYYS